MDAWQQVVATLLMETNSGGGEMVGVARGQHLSAVMWRVKGGGSSILHEQRLTGGGGTWSRFWIELRVGL